MNSAPATPSPEERAQWRKENLAKNSGSTFVQAPDGSLMKADSVMTRDSEGNLNSIPKLSDEDIEALKEERKDLQ